MTLTAYTHHRQCELYANAQGRIIACIPTREHWEASLEIDTTSYVTAAILSQSIGFEPNWN